MFYMRQIFSPSAAYIRHVASHIFLGRQRSFLGVKNKYGGRSSCLGYYLPPRHPMATWLTYHQFLTDSMQAWIQLQDSIFQDQVRDQDKTLSCEITTLKNKVSRLRFKS